MPIERTELARPGGRAGVLYCGDNLEVLGRPGLIAPESVDLIYLDPPFNSRRIYNIVKGSGAEEIAFKDHWAWEEAAPIFARWIESADAPQRLRTLMRATHETLKDDDASLLAYLAMMSPRLVALHKVLKTTGSLYLHCDPVASHYLKMMLDAVFGRSNFRNEIVWKRTASKGLQTVRLARNHDVILSYQKSATATWNAEATYIPYDSECLDEKTLKKYSKADEDGRRYHLDNLTNPNHDRPNLTYEFLGVTRVWRWTEKRMHAAYAAGIVIQPRPGAVPRMKRYLDEQRGKPHGDVWSDIPPINSQASERLGYPTQKPLALLERIVAMSTDEGDLVLDPFCGCGTTLEASERMGRRWSGIDVSHEALNLTRERIARLGPVRRTD